MSQTGRSYIMTGHNYWCLRDDRIATKQLQMMTTYR